jgi:hypothetical protein
MSEVGAAWRAVAKEIASEEDTAWEARLTIPEQEMLAGRIAAALADAVAGERAMAVKIAESFVAKADARYAPPEASIMWTTAREIAAAIRAGEGA